MEVAQRKIAGQIHRWVLSDNDIMELIGVGAKVAVLAFREEMEYMSTKVIDRSEMDEGMSLDIP
jgi:hypothetical protein